MVIGQCLSAKPPKWSTKIFFSIMQKLRSNTGGGRRGEQNEVADIVLAINLWFYNIEYKIILIPTLIYSLILYLVHEIISLFSLDHRYEMVWELCFKALINFSKLWKKRCKVMGIPFKPSIWKTAYSKCFHTNICFISERKQF